MAGTEWYGVPWVTKKDKRREERLPRLDRLEGYRPGSPRFYNRVLVPVFSDGAPAAAWAYVGREDFRRMPHRLLHARSWSAGCPS